MKINKLQINDFGKFSNKVIEFEDKINIVKGNNEAGKSTILKFIISMFFGISTDRRKSSFTDYDKYFPWERENFSGKITYTLGNGEKYEVFRDFTKKMPVVYNENAEDITSKYSSNKTKGSSFFEEQTGIDERIMTSSMLAEQGETIIDQSSENFVIQKIANLARTGDEKVSYENAQSYLTKKRKEDVGTEKSKNRPYNILTKEKKELLAEKNELEGYTAEQYEIEEKISQLQKKSEKNEKMLNLVNDYKRIMETGSELKNKIDIYQENIKRNNEDKERIQKQLDGQKEDLEETRKKHSSELIKEELQEKQRNEKVKGLNEDKAKNNKRFIIVAIVSALIAIICFFFKLIPVAVICILGSLGCLIFNINSKKRIEKEIKETLDYEKSSRVEDLSKIVEEIEGSIKEKEMKIGLIDKSNREIQTQIENQEYIINNKKQEQIDQLANKYKNVSNDFKEIIENEDLINKAEMLQKICNEDKLEIQKYQYRKEYIMPKLERLAEVQEKIIDINEKFEDLEKKSEAISLAMEVLEESYEEMKEKIVPRFTENLSNTISKISNGKYSKVVTNDKEGIMVEKQNGEYIPAKALSIGTIDQLYLSLRISISMEATSENMPIILDEAFAYYDSKRLKNILNYISEELKENQIILFTCTSREITKLDKLGIKYNLIEIE